MQPTNKFLQSFLLWTALEFAIAGISGFIFGPILPHALYPLLSIGLFVFLLVSGFLIPKMPSLAPVVAVTVPGVLGIFLYATIKFYLQAGMSNIVTLAGIGTAFIFGITATIAYFSKKSLNKITPFLFGLICAMFGISLLNSLFFHMPILSLIIAYIALVVFTLYVYIDMQKVYQAVRNGSTMPACSYAVSIFLDVYNLFVSLLRILSSFR